MFDFTRITLFCSEKRISKHKMTYFLKIGGGHGPFSPPGYAYVSDPPLLVVKRGFGGLSSPNKAHQYQLVEFLSNFQNVKTPRKTRY